MALVFVAAEKCRADVKNEMTSTKAMTATEKSPLANGMKIVNVKKAKDNNGKNNRDKSPFFLCVKTICVNHDSDASTTRCTK